MKLPKRITPDSIKEAIVEVKYSSTVPHELIVGLLFSTFDDSYTYTNRAIQSDASSGFLLPPDIPHRVGVQSIMYNDKIAISFYPGSFVFNCLSQYIGWHDYRPEIEKALRVIAKNKQIKKWTRVGIRYITEYPEKDLKECVKFSFTFGLPQVQSLSTSFKSEFDFEDRRIVLTLANNLPAVRSGNDSSKPNIISTSVIDIDCIAEKLQIEAVDQLLEEIDKSHLIEKKIFFEMLQDEFLQTLNPEY